MCAVLRLATQEGLLPGRDLAEKAERARLFGFEGVEVWGSGVPERIAEIRRATSAAGVAVACICAGYRGALLAREPRERAEAMEDIGRLLAAAGELGAAGVIVVPIFGGPQVSDLRPWKDARALEAELLQAQLPRLDEAAAAAGAYVLLEPLNRYETHFLRTLADAAPYCQGRARVAIMADFFHMSIEETDIGAALRTHAPLVRHVHLADSNRQLPGHGHTDFVPGLRALADAGYQGWLSLECGVPGEASELLPRCAAHLRALVARARSSA
jgi:sugar phosphate isomerase/epimerase